MEVGTMYKKAVVIGNCDELGNILQGNDFDEIVVTLGINEYNKLERLRQPVKILHNCHSRDHTAVIRDKFRVDTRLFTYPHQALKLIVLIDSKATIEQHGTRCGNC